MELLSNAQQWERNGTDSTLGRHEGHVRRARDGQNMKMCLLQSSVLRIGSRGCHRYIPEECIPRNVPVHYIRIYFAYVLGTHILNAL